MVATAATVILKSFTSKMKSVNILVLIAYVVAIAGSQVVFENDKTSYGANTSFVAANGTAEDKNLLRWVHSFADADTDPYLAKANAACLEGDLPECFKVKALSSLDDFFTKQSYWLNDNARIVRMPDEHVRSVFQEPYEFSSSPRAEEPEWDQFVKFLMRKVERFLKSTAFEMKFSDEVTERGRYSPRFIDEISSELDAIEDKKASVFTRAKLKKLLIPILIMVKLFKLKLLLFLPLILGLASFKKFLGFLAIVIPGLIGFFKLCKPDLHHNYGSFGHSSFYHRPPHQYGSVGRPDHTLYVNEYRGTESPDVVQYLHDTHAAGNRDYYAKNSGDKSSGSTSAFPDDAQKLAYNGYQQKRK